jgi:peptide/nickel transport system permease protein
LLVEVHDIAILLDRGERVVRYLRRRLVNGLLVLFALSVLAFALVRLIPGDPVASRLGQSGATPQQIAALRQELGLTGSPVVQYFRWLGHLFTGDFGHSLLNGEAVRAELATRVPVSLELAVIASVIAIAWGVAAGIVSAARRGGPTDGALRGIAFLGMSVPPFVVGTVMVLLSSLYLPKWPITGYTRLTDDPVRNLQGLLLPAIALSLPLGAVVCRYTRASLVDVLGNDFLLTARAKGAGEFRLVIVHALRNALVPVVTVSGVQLAGLVGGAVIIEQVFALPGVGSLMVQSISSNDYPMIQGCILVIGAIFVILNLAVDLLYPAIDPRLRVHA